MSSNQCNRGTGTSDTTLCFPKGLATDSSDNLYVADYFNARVVAYNTPLTDATADIFVGKKAQPECLRHNQYNFVQSGERGL